MLSPPEVLQKYAFSAVTKAGKNVDIDQIVSLLDEFRKAFVANDRDEMAKIMETIKAITGVKFKDEAEELYAFLKSDVADVIDGAEYEEIVRDPKFIRQLKMIASYDPRDFMVLKFDNSFNSRSLIDMAKDVFDETSKVVFPINKSFSMKGRVVASFKEARYQVEVAVIFSKKGGEEGDIGVRFFGEAAARWEKKLSSFSPSFYKYRFMSESGKEFILLSDAKMPVGERVHIYGTKYSVSDKSKIGEKAEIGTSVDIVFVHSFESALASPSEKTKEAVRRKVSSHDKLAKRIFGGYRHPEWFEKLLISTLLVNEEYGYPTHMIMIGPPGTGKTKLLQSLRVVFDEQAGIASGKTGTEKGLVPSFRESYPQPGYLVLANRVALVDEMLGFIARDRRDGTGAFGLLTDLLEHNKTTAVSGTTSSMEIKMTATMIAMSNFAPEIGISTPRDMLTMANGAFLSRCLIYFQTEKHIEFVKSNWTVENALPKFDEKLLNVMIWLRDSVRVKVDGRKVLASIKKIGSMIPAEFMPIFKARHDHHMFNLVSGLVKYYWLIGKLDGFEPTQEIYDEAEALLGMVVATWSGFDTETLALLPPKLRLSMLASDEFEAYKVIEDQTLKKDKMPVAEASTMLRLLKPHIASPAGSIRKLEELDLIKRTTVNMVEYYVPYWYGTKKKDESFKYFAD